MESHCTKEPDGEHGDQLLTLCLRFWPGLASFQYDPKCCGDPWTIHVLQRGTELCKGRLAEEKLHTTYRVDVHKMKLNNPTQCNAVYVRVNAGIMERNRPLYHDIGADLLIMMEAQCRWCNTTSSYHLPHVLSLCLEHPVTLVGYHGQATSTKKVQEREMGLTQKLQ